MKDRIIRTIGIVLSAALLFLAFTFSVIAEAQEITTEEHDVTITISPENASYIYVEASVPNGWGGAVDVVFHSLNTGRNNTVSLNYIENEYHSGIWLRHGKYTVDVELPHDDGMCLAALAEENNSTIEVRKGTDTNIVVNVVDNPDFDFTPPELPGVYVPPATQEDYNDLYPEPTNGNTIATSDTTSTICSPEGNASTDDTIDSVVTTAIILLVVIIILIAVLLIICSHKDYDDND